jgi:hypothetical protein
MTTPCQYTKIWMGTAAANTVKKTGIGMSVLAYIVIGAIGGLGFFFAVYGHDKMKEQVGPLIAFVIVGPAFAWAAMFLFSCVTAPYQLYFKLEQSSDSQCALLTKERDAAIAAHEKQIDRKKAYSALTKLIRDGSDIRDLIETAVLNPSGYVIKTPGCTPTADIDLRANIWRARAEQIAEEFSPKLHAHLLALRYSDPGTVLIGPSHRSVMAAKMEQILDLLAKDAARFCD